jgi:hypothetical protein
MVWFDKEHERAWRPAVRQEEFPVFPVFPAETVVVEAGLDLPDVGAVVGRCAVIFIL